MINRWSSNLVTTVPKRWVANSPSKVLYFLFLNAGRDKADPLKEEARTRENFFLSLPLSLAFPCYYVPTSQAHHEGTDPWLVQHFLIQRVINRQGFRQRWSRITFHLLDGTSLATWRKRIRGQGYGRIFPAAVYLLFLNCLAAGNKIPKEWDSRS